MAIFASGGRFPARGSSSSSGRTHSSSSGKFWQGGGAPSKKPTYIGGTSKPSSSRGSYTGGSSSKKSAGVSSSDSSYHGGSSSHSSYHGGSSSNRGSYSGSINKGTGSSYKKGTPTYIAKNGAVFDENFNHIPTEKVPVYNKGPAWSSDNLISFEDRNRYGDYSDNVYDNAYDEITIGGGIPSYHVDTNPYKDIMKEMNKLREENLALGKKALYDETDDYMRSAYINHVRNMNALPEKLFRDGSTGGLTESALTYMDSAYKNAVRDIEKARLKALGDLHAKYSEGSMKDANMTMDHILKETEKLESERRAYAKLLEQRYYKEKQDEREMQMKYYKKYYGI